MTVRLLLIEDNPGDALLLQRSLEMAFPDRYWIAHAASLGEARMALTEHAFHAVLLDLGLPDSQGLRSVEAIRAAAPALPLVAMTGLDDEKLASEAIRRGAQDYLLKGQADAALIARSIRHAIERTQADQRARLLAEVASQLLLSSRPQEVVESLCRKVMDHLDCHAFFNFLVDEPSGRLRLNAWAGIPQECARQIEWLDFGVAVCGCVARDGCRIVAEHVQTTPDPRTELVRSLGIEAYACHPLLNQGQIIGTLSFGSRTKPVFSDDELALMKTVTDHVAIAMQRIRLLEASNKLARAAEAASLAKSQFLASMSHELRTPMNAILGMTDLALSEPLPPAVRDYLQTAKESADLLLELLSEVLDFSRFEAGRFELESAAFNLRHAVQQVAKALRVRAGEKGLQLICTTPPELPEHVIGDGLRLRQVLMNLIGNAIKFTDRGEVEISVREIEGSGISEWGLEKEKQPYSSSLIPNRQSPIPSPAPSPQPPAPSLTLAFAVRDTGIGIPAEDQQRIFSPFTQADASTTRRYGGTGLGLAIVERLVSLMGGRIWLESQPGKGSTFFFTLQLLLAQGRSGAEKAILLQPADCPDLIGGQTSDEQRGDPPAVPARMLRVLVAEDTPANQKVVRHFLGSRGHKVEIADNGRQAVDRLCGHSFDVLLMDIQMPEMDGFQATAAIRQLGDATKSHVPIIAMTAHALKGDRERCLAAGMDAYISKPVKREELIETVERLGTDGAAGRRSRLSGPLTSSRGPTEMPDGSTGRWSARSAWS